MKKKIMIAVMVLFVALSVAACKDDADTTAPVISGTRDIEYIIDRSSTPDYTNGVTAYDDLDGDLTASIEVDSSAVDLTTPGEYDVDYSVDDLSGNVGTASITVTVIDATAPTISGIPSGFVYAIDNPSTLDYTAGVTASDNVDGDLTSAIVVDSSAVDLTTAGLYTVYYSVSDSSDNESATYSTYVQVKLHDEDADLVPPTFNGQANVTLYISYELDENGDFVLDENDDVVPFLVDAAPDYTFGVVAVDNLDGDVSDTITADDSAVDYFTPGTYNVILSAEDSVGNVGTATVKVTIALDDEKPVFAGVHIIEYYIGDSALTSTDFLEGITVTDNANGDITARLTYTYNTVDFTTPGRYTVYYSVDDAAGNTETAEAVLVVYAGTEYVYDPSGVYRTYTSGTDNLNPYSETLATASELYGYVTDGLYEGDYDWAAARQQLVDEGVTGLPAEIGFTEWYAAGKTAAELPYGRFPAMAAADPVDVNGDGTVWQITLRSDLYFYEYNSGTGLIDQLEQITASTFNYSWSMLLDPDLLNDRGSNLYADTDLPLLNAEDYFKQNSFEYKVDGLNFPVYDVSGTEFARDNSYDPDASANTGYDLYFAETGQYQNYWAEYWGEGYSSTGWVLVDYNDNAFYLNAAGDILAPATGETYLDANGDEIPARNAVIEGVDTKAVARASAYPAYMDASQNRVAVDANGAPVDGVYADPIPVTWDQVGFKVLDSNGDPIDSSSAEFTTSLTFEITLSSAKTAWDVMGALSGGTTGVVYEDSYEAGMNTDRTQTDYGTIDNPLVSYGPYVLSTWDNGALYLYELNDQFYGASDYRINTIRYDVIEDQSIAVEEFKAGRLDVVGASGDYYAEFRFTRSLKETPATTFFRFAFNVGERPDGSTNLILSEDAFRQAFYYAIDREEFTTSVRPPSFPTYGFLGPVYLSTEYGSVSYRSSSAGQEVLADYAPDTFGYDPATALTLFEEAYAALIANGDITNGDVVSVEYKFYDVETNWKVANWVKDTVEAIFNSGTYGEVFELELAAVSSAALNDAWDNGDFDMTFGGWQGLNFDAPSMLGQVYNSSKSYMLEQGFNTADAPILVSLPNSKVALAGWISDYETTYGAYMSVLDAYYAAVAAEDQTAIDAALADYAALTDEQVPSSTLEDSYYSWLDLYDLFGVDAEDADGNPIVVGDDEIYTTYNELFNYAYGELYNVNDINYAGKTDDFDAITAALEGVLLDQMIAIPLFTSVSATAYSNRVIFEADSYHAWMGWGGLKYMYIGTPAS